MKYPLAPNGIFSTIQGEGIMLGVPMVFVRLAGCSVGCKECDTDYSVSERSKPDEIAERVAEVSGKSDWVWITGGEPTDHDLVPLFAALRRGGFRIAVATAGTRLVPQGSCWDGVDFLSVSPHSVSSWMQKSGSQINIVPGLNGLKLKEIDPDCGSFTYRYVTPCDGPSESVAECVDFVSRYPHWRLGVQAHKAWGLA